MAKAKKEVYGNESISQLKGADRRGGMTPVWITKNCHPSGWQLFVNKYQYPRERSTVWARGRPAM